MLTEQNVKVEIVKNPTLNINDVDFDFKVPQQFGGLKREITVKRNQLTKLIADKSYSYINLAKKLGVTVYTLRRFMNKKTLKPDIAQALFNSLYSTDLTVEFEPERFNGANKMNIRYLFISYIIKSGLLKGRFFTLPSETCAFENELNIQTSNKFHFIGAEHDKDIFMSALQTIAKFKLKMSLTLGKAREVLFNAPTEHFTHIFADYCGTFPSFVDDVRTIFTNNLVKRGGLIGLTFTSREANTKNQMSNEFIETVNKALNLDIKPTTMNGIKLKLLSLIGKNYEIVEFEDYYDNGHMIFVLIKRTR